MKRSFAILVAGITLCIAATAQANDDLEQIGKRLGKVGASLAELEALRTGQEWRERECRYQSLESGTWTDTEERLTARCVAERWGIDLATMIRIGACESGWWRLAVGGSGSTRYLGLFQHSSRYWSGRVSSLSPPAWDRELSGRWQNSRSQLTVTARMVEASGWGAWACA